MNATSLVNITQLRLLSTQREISNDMVRCMSSLGLYLEWSLPPHDLHIVFVIVIPVGAHIFCSVKASRDYVTSKYHAIDLSLDWPGHVGEHQSGRCCHDTQKGQPEWHWKQNCDSDSVSVRSESFHCIHCISFFLAKYTWFILIPLRIIFYLIAQHCWQIPL